MASIKIENVAKQFGSVTALEAIDLDIADQEFVVLLGASGCGKTTLLRIIAGLEQASSGRVHIGEQRVDHLPPRKRGIAMVFQNYAVFPHLSVFENIAFGLRMNRITESEIQRRVNRNAELMHIESLLKRYSGELSGGQRQRVALARALAMEPDVILMDEPLSNLDALLRLEMRAELKGVLAQSNTTTIYVTHDQVEAMSLADRIAVMHQGKIVQAATPMEVYRDPATQFVASFIGNPPMNFIRATRVSSSRWRVANMEYDGPLSDLDSIEFAIRPEDVVVSDNGLAARVEVIEPLGPHILLTCALDGASFRAVVDSDIPCKVGDNIHLYPKADRVRWFDPSNAEVIQT